jgi:hypothetical protein
MRIQSYRDVEGVAVMTRLTIKQYIIAVAIGSFMAAAQTGWLTKVASTVLHG